MISQDLTNLIYVQIVLKTSFGQQTEYIPCVLILEKRFKCKWVENGRKELAILLLISIDIFNVQYFYQVMTRVICNQSICQLPPLHKTDNKQRNCLHLPFRILPFLPVVPNQTRKSSTPSPPRTKQSIKEFRGLHPPVWIYRTSSNKRTPKQIISIASLVS